MYGLIDDAPLTLAAILRRAATVSADRAVVSRSADGTLHRTTYGETAMRARRLGSALRRLGLGPGDRIGTLAWNHHRHLEAYLAVPALGAVLHTLNVRLHPDDIGYIASHAGDRALLVDESLLPLARQVAWGAALTHVIVMGDGPAPLEPLWPGGPVPLDYEALVAAADPIDLPGPADERRAAVMCYTSGTTGRPKGVVYSHRALALQALQLTTVDNAGIGHRETVLAVVPMFHINGWGLPFGAALAGAGLVLPGARLDAANLLELVASERVTLSGGVPTVWLGVLHALDACPAAYDIRSLRTLVLGGSAVPEALRQGYRDRYGVTVRQAWGMTETTSISTVCTLPAALDTAEPAVQDAWLARQGTPAPFFEMRARNGDGLVPWDGATMGELEVRGPTVASGYFGHAGSGDRFTDDGWLRTGDIVTITPGGNIALADRTNDLIKSGGEWISSVALENALMGHPDVAEAAVVAMPDPTWDERPLAVVVLKPGATVRARDLRAWLAPRFVKWWLPDAVAFMDAIPRSSTGKFLKSALREACRAGRLPMDDAR